MFHATKSTTSETELLSSKDNRRTFVKESTLTRFKRNDKQNIYGHLKTKEKTQTKRPFSDIDFENA